MSCMVKLHLVLQHLNFGYQEIERLFCKISEKITEFRKVVQVVRLVLKQYCTTSGSTGTPKVVLY
jgi:long-subunit acyl-CoA synthetase (AMP-forming)